jgi:outer membrane receptor protein involved in Fe transport
MDAVLVTGLSWQEVRDQLDATQGAQSFGMADPGQFIDDRHYHVWDSEIRLNGKFGSITWLAGLSYLQAGEHEERLLHALDGASVLTIDTTRRRASDAGFYLNATLPLTDRLDLEGGGRLFRSMLDVSRANSSVQASQENTRIGVTPSAALAWRPHEGRTIYARYDSAFRQGGLDFENSGRIHAYPGDEVTTFEVGWREQLPAGGQFEANAFYNWWDDLQSDMLEPNGLIETRTAGEARIIGTEISLTVPIGPSWQLSLGATAQSARLVHNVLGLALEDTRLPTILTTRCAAVWSVVSALPGQREGFVWPALYRPFAAQFRTPTRPADGQCSRQPGRVRLDLGAHNARSAWTISWVVRGISSPMATPFPGVPSPIYPQPPTSMRVTISRRF